MGPVGNGAGAKKKTILLLPKCSNHRVRPFSASDPVWRLVSHSAHNVPSEYVRKQSSIVFTRAAAESTQLEQALKNKGHPARNGPPEFTLSSKAMLSDSSTLPALLLFSNFGHLANSLVFAVVLLRFLALTMVEMVFSGLHVLKRTILVQLGCLPLTLSPSLP